MNRNLDAYAVAAEAPWIETVSGDSFYAVAPRFNVQDMAYAMSNQCRFTGHCRFFYSVAEHSLLVADLMEIFGWGDPREGLLHDGTEAYISDIASPWKADLPDYKRFERALDAKLRAHFDLPAQPTPECHHADTVALMIEARRLLPSRGENFAAKYRTPEVMQDVWRAEAHEHSRGWVLGRNPGTTLYFMRRHDRLFNVGVRL